MLRTILIFLLLMSATACSSLSYKELILNDNNGQMLSQVSGLGRFNEWVVVLVQDRNDLYVIKDEQLTQAFEQKQKSIRLQPVKLEVEGLKTASWEAIEFASVGGKYYVFLFHEHDYDGDNHQVYSAEVKPELTDFKVSKLERLGQPLPLLQSEEISLARRENYGYEAIIWDNKIERLLLLPELKSQPKFALTLSGELSELNTASHELRASDLTLVAQQCAIATSFCYQSDTFTDVLCTGNGGSPKLSLASFKITNEGLQLVESKDHTKDLMPVGFDPDYSNSSELSRTFNAEGIVDFNGGFLLANDNKPQGKSRTVIRYLADIKLEPKSCKFD